MHRPDVEPDGITPHEAPVALLLPIPRHRQCNGARLGNKRYEVERMLLEGEPKLKIARALKISAHSVRAVAHQMGEDHYAAPRRDAPALGKDEPPRESLPDTLKKKAIQAVDAITSEKLGKASPQACALVADRLLGRADALETRGASMDFLGNMMREYGIEPSHAVSRVTLEQKVTVERSRKIARTNPEQ